MYVIPILILTVSIILSVTITSLMIHVIVVCTMIIYRLSCY